MHKNHTTHIRHNLLTNARRAVGLHRTLSDRISIRVCFMLREMNIAVPEQVSIMGYSNYPGSQLMLPALSTIDIHLHKCGEIALEKLFDSRSWYDPQRVPEEIFTPYELLLRGSTAEILP